MVNERIRIIGLCATIILMVASPYWIPYYNKKIAQKSEAKGRVINIYEDKMDHYATVIKVEDGEKLYVDDWKNIGEYVNIGDSIIKYPDSLFVTVKKDSGESKKFKYKYTE
jgi:hypothetical protein